MTTATAGFRTKYNVDYSTRRTVPTTGTTSSVLLYSLCDIVDVQEPQSVEESNLPSSLFKHCSFTIVVRTSKNQTHTYTNTF